MNNIKTIDGNTDAGIGSGYSPLLAGGIGGGYVNFNTRHPSQTPLMYFTIPYDDGCESG
jgi:hypothetical protein